MRRERKTTTVLIFAGALLIVVFAVGLISSGNPDFFRSRHRYDYTLEQFIRLCIDWWIPAGIIGIPMFLISLVLSLVRESGEKRKSPSDS